MIGMLYGCQIDKIGELRGRSSRQASSGTNTRFLAANSNRVGLLVSGLFTPVAAPSEFIFINGGAGSLAPAYVFLLPGNPTWFLSFANIGDLITQEFWASGDAAGTTLAWTEVLRVPEEYA